MSPGILNVPKEAMSPWRGTAAVGRFTQTYGLSLWISRAKAHWNPLCCAQNCLQQTLSVDIVHLSSWGPDFCKVTHKPLFMGVSWLSVLTRLLLCLKEVGEWDSSKPAGCTITSLHCACQSTTVGTPWSQACFVLTSNRSFEPCPTG